MYRPTFAVDCIGEDSEEAIALSIRQMQHLLHCLVAMNLEYFKLYNDRMPWLYSSGVKYDRMEPPPGSACGDDDWQDVRTCLKRGLADCEELAAWRVAELRYRSKVQADTYVTLQRMGAGIGSSRHLYHIQVKWPRGLREYPATVYENGGSLIEDPSAVLGMKE